MIPMEIYNHYIGIDTDEWIGDRTDANTAEAAAAETAFDAFQEAHNFSYETEAVTAWLESLNATGLYHDGPASTGCTVNEETFLSEDIIYFFAHTEEYGDLYLYQYGYMTSATVHFTSFIGDDDADAFSFAFGYANCSNTECKSEWIIESTTTLWNNGGSHTVKIYDLLEEHPADDDGDRHIICPICTTGDLSFYSA